MPTRLIHEQLLTSPSLLRCSPRARDAFHRLLLIADDFGCFEADVASVKGRGFAKCADVSAAELVGWLAEWSREMLFLWEQGGRVYGYLTGWHKEHGQRWRAEYRSKRAGGTRAEQRGSKRKTPRPPGWTGAEPVPWAAPADWTPGTVFPARADASPADRENLSLFLPAREESSFGGGLPAIAVAVADAVPDAVAPGAPAGAAGARGEQPAEPAGPAARGPSALERIRGAVVQELGLSRSPGQVGIALGQSRRLGEMMRDAEAAVALRGFAAVVQACAAHGRDRIARGDQPETMAAFGWLLRALAAPDDGPARPRATSPPAPTPGAPRVPLDAARARATGPWARVLGRLTAGPDVERWLTPLEVVSVNGALTLRAPSAAHAAYVAERWGPFLPELAGIAVCVVAADVSPPGHAG